MPALYLTEQGSTLRKTGRRLIVEKDDQELLELQCFKIDTIFLFGGVQVTTQALTEVLSQGITLVLLTQDGRLKGRLVPPLAKNSILRAAQYERRLDQNFALELAKAQIAAKITSLRQLLLRQLRNHPELPIRTQIDEMAHLIDSINRVESLQSLLGIEGNAARAYYTGFKGCLRKNLGFPGRRRRPPTDPVNSLLSLGYVMLTSEILAQLEGIGFDPYLGFYHQLDYGRPSLALDLVEEFRVVVDQLVLRLVNNGVVKAEHFETEFEDDEPVANGEKPAGVRLRPDRLKAFLYEWSEHLEGTVTDSRSRSSCRIRTLIRSQCHRLADHVLGKSPYSPCVIRP